LNWADRLIGETEDISTGGAEVLIALRIRQITDEVIQIGEGSLYPALYRMELKGWIKAEWGITENNRKAKYYKLTRTGRKQLEGEVASYARLTEAIAKVLQTV
jgi:PadR family transcriptional regulator, regulatory protein PadR